MKQKRKNWICTSKLILLTTLIKLISTYYNINKNREDKCIDFICSTLNSIYCMKREISTVLIHIKKACTEYEECVINEQFTGYCVNKEENTEVIRFPGERCEISEKKLKTDFFYNECKFGPKICDEDLGVCRGYGLGEKCNLSADCDLGLYCGKYICKREKGVEDVCEEDFECGHTGFCYFQAPGRVFGVCRKYMGLKVGEKAVFELDNGICTNFKYISLFFISKIFSKKYFLLFGEN